MGGVGRGRVRCACYRMAVLNQRLVALAQGVVGTEGESVGARYRLRF